MRYIILEFIIPSIKVLFYLLDHHAQAEYDDVVACLDKGVARNQYTFTIADQAADGSPLGQSQVFKEHLPQLLRRADIEFPFGQGVDGSGEGSKLSLDVSEIGRLN